MIFAYSQIINGEPTVTAGQLHQYDAGRAYPVNKVPIDWNTPIGIAKAADGNSGFDMRSAIPGEPSHSLIWNINEFCSDCHDGNTGLHTVAAPIFSEDRALRAVANNSTAPDNWRNSYDIAYGHDANPRHCGRQMRFNPEDATVFGPHCRNCHKGSSGCGRCHSESSGAGGSVLGAIYPKQDPPSPYYTLEQALAVSANNNRDRAGPILKQDLITGEWVWVDSYPGAQGQSMYHVKETLTKEKNIVFDSSGFAMHGTPVNAGLPHLSFMYKKSRTANWYKDWRTSTGYVKMGEVMKTGVEVGSGVDCSDDGFSWLHRTLGWKMLKDDLFGLNLDGTPVAVGQTRSYGGTNYVAHDLDSVCLDCHNPTVWRATSASNYTDKPGAANTADDHNDELLTRGLP